MEEHKLFPKCPAIHTNILNNLLLDLLINIAELTIEQISKPSKQHKNSRNFVLHFGIIYYVGIYIELPTFDI